jgi:hypothetical protein
LFLYKPKPKPKPKLSEQSFEEKLPWKGKKSGFFVMVKSSSPPFWFNELNPESFILSECQWDFIFKYYPEYSISPYELMTFLFSESRQHEQILSSYSLRA